MDNIGFTNFLKDGAEKTSVKPMFSKKSMLFKPCGWEHEIQKIHAFQTMWLGARNSWIIYQCCLNLCKAGTRGNFVTSLARKHQDMPFIARQMRETQNAMCLIVHVSAFVTYKRALRDIKHTQNTNTKNNCTKKAYKNEITPKSLKKNQKITFRRHRKTVKKKMVQQNLQ